MPTKDEDWPTIDSILEFRKTVRARLLKVYDDIDSGKLTLNRKVGRVLFMTFEHEALHAETLLYMLLQRAGTGTIPPPGFAPPPWDSLKATWDAIPPPKSSTVTLGPTTISLGHDDLEAKDGDEDVNEDLENHEFGWDNESPRRTVGVGQFRISWRPITNGEFYRFYTEGGKDKVDLPASWVKEGGEIKVSICSLFLQKSLMSFANPPGSNSLRTRIYGHCATLACNCAIQHPLNLCYCERWSASYRSRTPPFP